MRIITVLLTLSMVAGTTPAAFADDDRDGDDHDKFKARLSGYNEVIFNAGALGPTPPAALPTLRGAVSTTGKGKFKLEIDGQLIHYTLSYKDLEGDVTQAHIHFGQRFTPGGIVLFLCANNPPVTTAPPGTQPCPGPREGTVEGTLDPADVLAAVGQGIAAGEFDEVVRAIRNDATYANVHSSLHPQGEIRGHIEPEGLFFFHRH